MNKTKIDWCDSTVNPVVGCPNGCAYCYAHRINNRFGYVENWDCPEFKPDALKKFNAKASRAVFIDSMSDIGHWRPEWMVQILQAMANNPQHDYIALTKTSLTELNEKIGAALEKVDGDFDLYIGKIVIRVLDLAEYYGIDMGEAIAQKHAYNLTRPYKHGGKKL